MLKKVKKYYNKWRSVSGFRHFGYALSHTYELVKQYSKSVKVTILLHVHVPYSPDLAHATFFLSPKLKKSLFYLVVVTNPENWLSRCLRVLPKSLGYDAFLIENILKGCVVHSTFWVECSEQPLYTM